jgi:hypothetical protein
MRAAHRKEFDIFIGHLAPHTTKRAIARHFEAEGFLLGFISITPTNINGEPLAAWHARAVLETGDVDRAIELLNGTELNGKRIRVSVFKRIACRQSKSTPPTPEPTKAELWAAHTKDWQEATA